MFFSCEQRDGKSNLGIDTTKDSLRITNEIEIKKSERFSDTLYFNIENDSIQNDFIIINLIKDSVVNEICHNSTFEFIFYKNNTFSYKTKENISCYTEGSNWYFLFGLNEKQNLKNYLEIINGYEACGYIQHHFLYDVENEIQLIFRYETMSDSGWGEYIEFENIKTNSFSVKKVSFMPVDYNYEDELGIYEISDSVKFEKKNKKWKKIVLSRKGQIIKTDTISFSEFHKIE